MSDADKKDDATHIGGGPPVMPKRPAGDAAAPGAGAPPADSGGSTTEHGGAPPVLPGKVTPPAASVETVAAGNAPPPAESEETVAIGQVTRRVPFSLQRVQPPGHPGVVYLTSDAYLMGRKRGADLPLFSPTASREHARLEHRPDGWYIEPLPDKPVIANGSMVHGSVRLEHQMRLQIGGDELIFFDETVAVAEVAPGRAAGATPRRGSGRWIAIAVGLAAVAALLAWVLLSAWG